MFELDENIIEDIMNKETLPNEVGSPINKKILDLLTSKSENDVRLGLMLCKRAYPLLWSALVGITGIFAKDGAKSAIIHKLYRYPGIKIGSRVKYKAMPACPELIVYEMKVTTNPLNLDGNTLYQYALKISCRYFNKSTHKFDAVEDRIECFEAVDTEIEKDQERN